jgi:hypothetical protein
MIQKNRFYLAEIQTSKLHASKKNTGNLKRFKNTAPN